MQYIIYILSPFFITFALALLVRALKTKRKNGRIKGFNKKS